MNVAMQAAAATRIPTTSAESSAARAIRDLMREPDVPVRPSAAPTPFFMPSDNVTADQEEIGTAIPMNYDRIPD